MITTDFGVLKSRKFDVCVVGSGPVGACLAVDLAYRGLSVLVLESGLSKPDRRIQSLSDALIVSPQHHHPMSVAVGRLLGGTSALWGGRCVPLDEIDFEKRSFVPNSGWPIARENIAQYERRAAELIGCDDGGFTAETPPNFQEADIDFYKLERWVNETRIFRQQPELTTSDRIVVLLNATVVGFSIEAGMRAIKGVKVAREVHTTEFNCAGQYVLALGGIETARLLLNVQAEHPQLFGGTSGSLGRYYMGHISGSFASIRFNNPDQVKYFRDLQGKASFARRRLTFNAKAQFDNKILNVAFWPENAALFDADHKSGFLSLAFLLLNVPRSKFVAEAIQMMQRRKDVSIWPHFRNIINDCGGALAGVAEVIKQRYIYGRHLPRLLVTNAQGTYPLHFHSEQAPNPANRVRLTNELDWLGMARVAVEFTFSLEELTLVKKAHCVFDRSIRSLGIGKLIYHGAIDSSASLPQAIPDGLHQIGTTRMSDDPSKGIVNRDCRVFEFENLYIAGSSVFSTAGQASPTLPAVTLAVRLSEHLARRSSSTAEFHSTSGDRKSLQIQTRPLNILIVTASYYPAVQFGGPTYTVHSLARYLVKRRHKVVVYTTIVGSEQISHDSTVHTRIIDDVSVYYFSALIDRIYWSPPMIRNLRENAGNFDLIHAQGAFLYPTVAARNAASDSNIPFVYSPRGMLVESLINKKSFWAKSAWIRYFEVPNCNYAAFVHATSDVEAQEIKRLGIRPRSIEVIRNGLDVPEQESEEQAEARRRRLIGPPRPYVIILGRVSWTKGIDRLIQAMSYVTSADLVIAGNDDENYTPKLMDLLRQRGLENRVIFTGALYGMDKYALLRGAELFVLPAYSESFGVVLLEALSCGCPVIMTPEVGIAKEIERSEAGIVVPGTPEEIGAAISQLLADPDRRKRMGDKGRKVVLSEYSWEGVVDDMEAAYRRALIVRDK